MAAVPTKLHKLKIDRVDLCERGANPDARVMLYKSADGKHAVDIKKAHDTRELIAKTDLVEPIAEVVKMAGMMMGEAMDFDQMMQKKKMQEKMWKISDQVWEMTNCLRDSIMSVVEYGVGKQENASSAKIRSALEQFKTKAEAAIPMWLQHEEMPDDMDEEAKNMVGNMRKSVTKFMGYIAKEVGKMPVDRSKLSDEVRQLIESLEAKVEKAEEKVEKARIHTEKHDEVVAKCVAAEKQVEELKAEIAKSKEDPEEVFKRSLPESVRKRLEASEVRAKQAEEMIAKHEDKVRTEQYIAKAKEYPNLSAKAEELGLVLKTIADKCDEPTYKYVESFLTAANEQIKSGNLFKQNSNGSGGVEGDAYEKIAAKAREVAKNDKISFEKAFTKVLVENPELYVQYEQEAN